MTTSAVVYMRVSTVGQGEYGLGMEAQRTAVEAYTKATGANIVAYYTEVETGTRPSGRVPTDRPKLRQALNHCRRSKATLVVAKLDRLGRNVAFLSALMESEVNFVACDQPHANRLTLHILAAVAEAEAKAIGERTRAALAAAKVRGQLLGTRNPRVKKLTRAASKKGAINSAIAKKARTREAYADLIPAISKMRAEGMIIKDICTWLNFEGHTTQSGGPFTPKMVYRLLQMAGMANSVSPGVE